jgi:hypothetical protein
MKIHKKLGAWVIIILLILVIFIYPKECGSSYGGFIAKEITIKREEGNCFGVKYQAYSRFGMMYCADCGKKEYCVGVPISKTCYEWNASTDPSTEIEIECKK